MTHVLKPATIDLQDLKQSSEEENFISRDRPGQRSFSSASSSAAPSDSEDHAGKHTSEVSFMVNKGRVIDGNHGNQTQDQLPEIRRTFTDKEIRDTDRGRYGSSTSSRTTSLSSSSTSYIPLETGDSAPGLRTTKLDRIQQLIGGPLRKTSREEKVEDNVRPMRSVSVEHREDVFTKEPQVKLHKEELFKKTRTEKENSPSKKDKKDEERREKREHQEKLKRLERLVELHDQGKLDLGKKGTSGNSPRMSLSERLGGGHSKGDDEDGKEKSKLKQEKLEKLMKLIEQHDEGSKQKSDRRSSSSSKKSKLSSSQVDIDVDKTTTPETSTTSRVKHKAKDNEESSFKTKMDKYTGNVEKLNALEKEDKESQKSSKLHLGLSRRQADEHSEVSQDKSIKSEATEKTEPLEQTKDKRETRGRRLEHQEDKGQ